jgi:hypothetical protein
VRHWPHTWFIDQALKNHPQRQYELKRVKMIVKTKRPIIKATSQEIEEFINASGATRRAKKKRKSRKPRQQGQFGERVKTFAKKVVDSGVLPIIAAQMGTNPTDLPPIETGTDILPPDNNPPDSGNGKTILIAVGVIALVGVGLYMYNKKKTA